ncbi:pyroglutamyl-peptidase 1-like [Teleopsis dalmanni]|uniref:pyroglutamyl-peptidase 1-like n=1 Tax=Teleopsis dalmanni TaxID=139649 RepID=UPI0018CFBA63|nr:pyroglutamyl-peptidase 1-like [Teleopsis dalmanni]XP_037933886.1 pyroglutamyl-peptidase 1-like [Teleopsis dalmanni]XP_037933887.1 pyroglutamyl-peptidase 1-like [Teleopsis dalmanni]
MEKASENLIIVTGFGPFGGFEAVNPSWEAVKLLPDNFESNKTPYNIEKLEVPVEYAAVDKAIEEIWSRNPILVIHCGVHSASKCVLVEKLAYNNCFMRKDFSGCTLQNGSASLKNSKTKFIYTGLDVNKIIKTIEECHCKSAEAAAQSSRNPGNYLCGYIYLKSLDINRNRSLFVHVPQIDKPFSSQEVSDMIFNIVQECVRQIEEDNV